MSLPVPPNIPPFPVPDAIPAVPLPDAVPVTTEESEPRGFSTDRPRWARDLKQF